LYLTPNRKSKIFRIALVINQHSRVAPSQQAIYQQNPPLPQMHGLPNVYPPFAAAQGSLGYLSGPERHPSLIPLDDPSVSLDSNAPTDALPDHSASTPGSYYRPASNASAVEAARALGAPPGGSFYPQQSPSWYGLPDPYQQQGLAAAGQLGYSDSPHGAYVSYQGGEFLFAVAFSFQNTAVGFRTSSHPPPHVLTYFSSFFP
jgi:hypothetical protein